MKKLIQKTLLIALCATTGQIMASDNSKAIEEQIIEIKVTAQTDSVEKQTWQSHTKHAIKRFACCLGPAAIALHNLEVAFFSAYSRQNISKEDIGVARVVFAAAATTLGFVGWNAGSSVYNAIKNPEAPLKKTWWSSLIGGATSAITVIANANSIIKWLGSL